tara:strand:- start:46 stop:1812 length:1767 start_codon:yes stop_codon:yes gene_type:complete
MECIIPENGTEIVQPKSMKINLFSHQKKAVAKLSEIETSHTIKSHNLTIRTNLGIYADKVGAGKTLTMAALISTCKSPSQSINKLMGCTEYSVAYLEKNFNNVRIIDSTLIIVPHSLINQWVDNLNLIDNEDFEYIVINKKAKTKWLEKENLPKVVLISNTFAKYLYLCDMNSEYDSVHWNRLVIDEPQTIVLPCQLPHANFTWFVCATPRSIIHSNRHYLNRASKELTNLWKYNQPIYRDLIPEYYGSYYRVFNPTDYLVVKNSDSVVDQSLKLPPYQEIIIKCKTPSYLRNRAIRDNLPRDALARLQANDVSGAIEILNCNTNSSSSDIIESLILKYKNEVHNENIEIQRLTQLRNLTNQDRNTKIKQHKDKIDILNSKIESITTRVQSVECCPICLEEITSTKAVTDCCQNSFCFECILMALSTKNRCPLCKEISCHDNLHIESSVVNNIKKNKVINSLPSKTNALLNIIENINEHSRILIFSQFDNSFQRIIWKLNRKNINFELLKGRLECQQKTIDNFKNGSTKILMLNANNFGAGLNLQMTTDIIIYHKFYNESLKHQVIGRAQRFGRQTPLKVTYLEHENE